ncbi:metallophosphoesterase [Hymenobacter latericus]|uniref:metallophosphoesterase n=1 Tax=Hymenobacter sp. YIM 151858-1 TaxID=2987688 RepID=UPI002227AA08|nr:metallophosphoesterase [Hymenobacter sp. YIM 151858-1]UYZ59564.1 metallophosphoesterase [Hymenobacter sp. YIM 151858-1]
MNLFVVGDVHGCYHTFEALLQHWKPAEELLIQVGDLVDRGRYSPECVQLARELEAQHPGHTAFLLGNHEYEMLIHYGPDGPNRNWLSWGGKSTVAQYNGRPNLLREHLAWLTQRPMAWENEHVVVSHAGIADTADPFDPDNTDGILWRRGPLRHLGKRQVVGHTPTDNGRYYHDTAHDALYIDTGAYRGACLTGLRLAPTGDILGQFSVPTVALDIA